MNRFLYRIRNFFAKESQARVVTSYNLIGQPVTTPANYEMFAYKGYKKNVIVFTAISKIATACMGIEWCLYERKSGRRKNWTELESHPLLDLWAKPNPMQSMSDFIESAVGFYKLSGNLYLEANSPFVNKPPTEIWPVRPDKMKVVPGALGYPVKYVFEQSGYKREWVVDQVTLRSAIMHLKTFNPANDWYGMSPLEAALLSVDQFNAGARWNLALMQNSATPSGVLQMRVTDANPRGEINDEQYRRLKAEFDEAQSGPQNAGRPLIIEGGLNWQTISLSPKDMDFLNNKKTTSEDVCIAYGVPPEIVGLGTKTYANYKEARLAFTEETILPTMDKLRDAVNRWLTPLYGDKLVLDYDRDDIEALVEKREAKYTSLQTVTFISENEKRDAAGFDEVEGMDVFNINGQLIHKDEFATWMDDATTDSTDDAQSSSDSDSTDDNLDNSTISDEGDGKSFKSFNLLNQHERQKSWRVQNKLRDRLARTFRAKLNEQYKDLLTSLKRDAKEFQNADPKLLEFAVVKTISDWAPNIEAVLKDQIKFSVETFGRRILREGSKAYPHLNETKANSKFDSYVLDYVEQRSGTQISTIVNTTQKNIKKIVSEWVAETVTSGDTVDELANYLQAEFEGLSKTNAIRIARTEVGAASTNGSLNAAKALQVPDMYKQWVSAQDSRVRDDAGVADHRHVDANNGEIPIDQQFKVDPDILMDGPGDPSAPAEQVINCRCVLVYKSKQGS